MNKNKKWGEDVYSLLSWFKIDKVKNAKVLVAGAGALGNEALKNLALFGVGNIVVVDFDKIEHSNLTRSILFRESDADKGLYKAEVAAKRIKEINPAINTFAICGNLATDVGLGLYRRMDVILGCLDSLIARILLNRLSFRAGKTWIDGGIGDLEGQVNSFHINKNCYECSLTAEEHEDLEARMSCAGVSRENESFGRVATTPVSASIIAAVQVQEAMKVIHEDELGTDVFTPLMGKMFQYEGLHPAAGIFEDTSYNEDCPSHEHWDKIIEIPQLGADMSVREALSLIKSTLNVESVEINMLNDKFVDILGSRSDNKVYYPLLPESKIPDYKESSEELSSLSFMEGEPYQRAFENIDDEFPYPELTLKQIGIPYWDVLQISTENDYFYVEMSADKDKYKDLFVS